INKGTIISWMIAFIIMGAAYGSIYGDMQTFLESNEMMKEMFSHSGVSIEKSFTSTIMMVMIVLVSILPIVIVNKLFSEEIRLHLSQIFASKVTRSTLYWTCISLAIFIGVVGILLAAGSLGATAITTMEDSGEMEIGDFIEAGYNFLPSVFLFFVFVAISFGWGQILG